MSHEFNVGDNVVVRLAGGSRREGIIVEIKSVRNLAYIPIDLYRVEFNDDKTKGLYDLVDLIWADDPDRLAYGYTKYECTCGAESVYYPNPAPGHAYHCRKFR